MDSLFFEKAAGIGAQMAEELRIKIVSGEIADEQKLSATTLAEEYGSSRAPVREALQIVEHEGLVKFNRQGVVVAGLTEKDFDEFYDVRFMLELFCFTHLLDIITPEHTHQMDAIIDRMELALKHRDYKEWTKHDMHFHDYAFTISSHRFIKLFWENIRQFCHAVTYVATKMRFEKEDFDYKQEALIRHRQIVIELRSGDKAKIEEALRQHFRQNGWLTESKI